MHLLLIVLSIRVKKYNCRLIKILWIELFFLYLFFGHHLFIVEGEEHAIQFDSVQTFNHEGAPIEVVLKHLLQLIV